VGRFGCEDFRSVKLARPAHADAAIGMVTCGRTRVTLLRTQTQSFFMKSQSILALALAVAASAVFGQSVTTTTTREVTSSGVISSFEPQSFAIKS
jgi:hypothetical protein